MKIEKQIFINKINALIIKSLLYEVSCYPSPGLVSPISNGAHTDMDYYTFIDSISEITPFFKDICELSMSTIPEEQLLSKIRPIGIEIEKHMFLATNNINTHKGLIFLLSITCAAVSKAYYNNASFSEVPNIIRKISHDLVKNELLSKITDKPKTYGEKIFLEYGITGVRGEVEKGLPTVFNYSLPFYQSHSYLNKRQRLFMTLLCIMAHCEDSTLLHRHKLPVLKEVNLKSKEILGMFDGENIDFIQSKIENLDEDFSKRKISPGGSADLLAITVLLDGIKEYI